MEIVHDNTENLAMADAKTSFAPHTSPSIHDDFGDSDIESRQLTDRYSLMGAASLYITMSAAPLAVGNSLTVIPGILGGAMVFWGTLIGVIFQMMVCLSVSEIASSFPHALGPSFWASSLAPPNWKREFSYWVAVANSMQTQFDSAAFWVFTIEMISCTVTIFSNLQFELTTWQSYLIILGMIFISLFINTSSRALNIYAKTTIPLASLVVITVIFQIVCLLVRADPKQTAYDMFVKIDNNTGWKSVGFVFLMATQPGNSVVTGFNYVAHMSEELPNPRRSVPLILISSSVFNALSSILMIAILNYCTSHPDNLNNPIGDVPYVQILWDGNRSMALTGINMICMCLIYIQGAFGFLATSSRLIWNFAEHNGLAYSSILGRVHQRKEIPLYAVMVCAAFAGLICLLYMGPSTVLNALFGFSQLSVMVSYGVPIWLLVLRGRQHLDPNRYFNLGRFGLPINIISGCWMILAPIVYTFPTNLPVTADNMNYAAPVFVGIYALFIPNWFYYAKKNYVLPHVLLTTEGVTESQEERGYDDPLTHKHAE